MSEYFLERISKKNIKKIKSKYLTYSLIFILLGILSIILSFLLSIFIGIIGFIFLIIGFIFFLNSQEKKIKRNEIRKMTTEFLVKLPEILSQITTEIHIHSSINLIYSVMKKRRDDPIINEILRIIELGSSPKLVLSKYIEDDILLDFLELIDIIIYKKYNKEEDVLDIVKIINQKINLRIEINSESLKSTIGNILNALIMVFIFIPIIVLIGASYLYYVSKTILISTGAIIASSLFLILVLIGIINFLHGTKKKILQKI